MHCNPLSTPPSLLFDRYWDLFIQRTKLSDVEAVHSPPSIVVVRNACSYTSTLPYAFMACTGTATPVRLLNGTVSGSEFRGSIVNNELDIIWKEKLMVVI
jgi:hypothetical protein